MVRPTDMELESNTRKVAALIPEDGSCIRFKDLEAECKGNKIKYKAMLTALKRLEADGTIVKEAVKADRGAGTCYRRTVFLHSSPTIPGDIQTFSDFISYLKSIVQPAENTDEQAKLAVQGVHNALYVLFLSIYDELVEYTRNPNKKLAEKRLNSVLKDFILPLVMKTTELAALPGACSKQSQVALDCAHAESLKDWDKIWKCAASLKDTEYDYCVLMQKLDEYEKVVQHQETQ